MLFQSMSERNESEVTDFFYYPWLHVFILAEERLGGDGGEE
jgi:hypothetical protein